MVDNNVALTVFKIFFIFITSLFSISLITKLHFKSDIEIFLMVMEAIGITGVIVCYTMF